MDEKETHMSKLP